MSISGKYADVALKDLDTAKQGELNLGADLRKLASKIPDGSQKNYILLIAKDFDAATGENSSLEDMLALAADLRPEKMRIVCPN